MEDGCLMDTYKKKTFQLNELAEKLCAVSTLRGKPKMFLIEEYGCGRSSYLLLLSLLAMIALSVVQSST